EPFFRSRWPLILLPAHTVRVSVFEVTLARVEVPRPLVETELGGLLGEGALESAQRDHTGGASVDAKLAPGAFVLVDDEESVVGRLLGGVVDVHRLRDGIQRQVMDALPRANVDAPFAEDALRLIDVEELLRPQLVREIVPLDESELVVVPERRRLVDDALRHQPSPLTSGRP